MRIMLVISGLGMGGAERVVTSLADRFVALGHEVLLVALGGQVIVLPARADVRVENLGIPKSLLGALKGLQRMRCLVREFAPDVIHSHMVHANLAMRFLRVITPYKRLVTTAHNTNEEGRIRMLLYRMSDRFADISTNVSDEAVESFRRQRAFRADRMITVHNGIEVEEHVFSDSLRNETRNQLQIVDGCFLFLAVGRLEPQKDYRNLIGALRQLPVSADWHLLIVGDGVLREALKREVLDSGLDKRVTFLGLRRDVPALMCAADAFVLSSAYEGFPMVVGEAMACERVVVATDCGGISEFVGEHRQFIVPPHESKLLAEAMTRAMNASADLRRQMGHSLRDRVVKNFSLDAAVKRWLQLYRPGHADRHDVSTPCAE